MFALTRIASVAKAVGRRHMGHEPSAKLVVRERTGWEVSRAPPHSAPHPFLPRSPFPAQSNTYRMVATATVTGFVFAFAWRGYHGSMKDQYESFYAVKK